MPAAYDSYNYQDYWEDRQYEHMSEVSVIKGFLDLIPRIKKIIEIGGGFGRMVPYYAFRAKSVTLTDPSASLLSQARELLFSHPNVNFIQSKIENFDTKFRASNFDLAIMIRVMHHSTNPGMVIKNIARILKPQGYFILEFANKIHFKNVFKNAIHGNLTYLADITPEDRRSKKMIKKGTLPFVNYHPDEIKNLLKENGFKILEVMSVSNIRSPFLKRYLPLSILILLEKLLQKPLSYLNFGPSIFILSRKMG